MNKQNIIDLTGKVYRITLLFPKKEPLRYKLRETADDVLKDISILEINSNDFKAVENLKKNLEIIGNYFEVAKQQNWASYFDILEIEEEYDKIDKEFLILAKKTERAGGVIKETEKNRIILMPETSLSIIKQNKQKKDREQLSIDKRKLDMRKEKILELLKIKNKIQVWEASKTLPNVSKRTIRRDFVQLLELGLIERIGERNETFYRLR